MWFGDARFPLSEEVFEALLAGGANHVFVMPTTLRRAQVTPTHPYGHYDPRLGRSNAHWRDVDAGQLAQAVVADHEKWGFDTDWVFSNEISYSQWRTSANEEYRLWLVAFVESLASAGLTPAVYSPITDPRSEGDKWSALAAAGHVAVEGYLDAASVARAHDASAYSATQYAAIRASYEALGVPVDRCILVEHYSQTAGGTGWGRGGLALDDWLGVIGARIAGAREAGFTRFASYGWGYNPMSAPDSDIVATATAYVDATPAVA
jgi:hypothetical protein